MAPDAGFEPATKRLTAAYSTAELIRNLFSLGVCANKTEILRKNHNKVKDLLQKSRHFFSAMPKNHTILICYDKAQSRFHHIFANPANLKALYCMPF